MKVTVSFEEIKSYISKYTDKQFELECVASDTVRISHRIKLLGSINADIKIEKIENADIYVSYSGSFGVDLLVEPLVKVLKFYMPETKDVIEQIGSKALKISLGKMDKLEKVLEYMTLQDVSFHTDGVVLDILILKYL